MVSQDAGKTWNMWKQDYSVNPPVTSPVTSPTSTPVADKKLGTIIPLYVYPNNAAWTQLAGMAPRYPRVHVVAVINPNNGVGTAQDVNYVNGVRLLRANAITVIGYVATGYGAKSLDTVKAEIDKWFSLYPDVDGIFFDEMANTAGKESYYAQLVTYVRGKKAEAFTVGNPGSAQIESYFSQTGLNNILIYENAGYPATATLKQTWMSKYERSRFGVIPYGVPQDTTQCRNFVGMVAGVEKVAGYVYCQTDTLSNPWDSLSMLTELTIQELDRIAANEGIISPPATTPTTPTTTNPTPTTTDSVALDKFGIKKIYATKTGGNEWFINMTSPTSDSRFRNLPTMTKQADGSWRTTATQVRMEAWSPDNNKWLNVEITAYLKSVTGVGPYICQEYSRGGHHTDSRRCEGSALKGRLYSDGRTAGCKEINHPAYTGNRGVAVATTRALKNRWVGFKTVIYNYQVTGNPKVYTMIETYIDDDVNDAQGNLVIRNNWKKTSSVKDEGGWSTSDSDFESACSPLDKNYSHQYRQRGEILNLPGGTSLANLCAWRTDDNTTDWKFLSAREITPPKMD